MDAVSRQEVSALAALRESEYAHQRRVSRGENADREMRRVEQCKRRLVRASCKRDELLSAHRPRKASDCPDSLQTFVVYDKVVSAGDIRSLSDVQRTLQAARRSWRVGKLTPRCVLPPFLAGPFASMQNIDVREHAVVSLLLRWIMNTHPSAPQIERAAKKWKVDRRADALVDFGRRAGRGARG